MGTLKALNMDLSTVFMFLLLCVCVCWMYDIFGGVRYVLCGGGRECVMCLCVVVVCDVRVYGGDVW